MPFFIVVVVYNYRIAYFVEVFLYQLAQQVKLPSTLLSNIVGGMILFLSQHINLNIGSNIYTTPVSLTLLSLALLLLS